MNNGWKMSDGWWLRFIADILIVILVTIMWFIRADLAQINKNLKEISIKLGTKMSTISNDSKPQDIYFELFRNRSYVVDAYVVEKAKKELKCFLS